ncbi:MAG: hypothetical protein VX642_09500, partial [Bdellovibrionota bacterium]|nr:hypothetical protein [Bdellovibrionota bacterium]
TLRRSIKSIAFINGEKICDEIVLNDAQNKALDNALNDYVVKILNKNSSRFADETTMNSLKNEIRTVDNTDYHILERVVGKDKSSPDHVSCVVVD